MAKEKTAQPVKTETDSERKLRILKAAQDSKPLKPEELQEVRGLIANSYLGKEKLSALIMDIVIANLQGLNPLRQEVVRCEMGKLRTELGFDHAPTLEKLLIDQICACYLRVWVAEYRHTFSEKGERTLNQAASDQRTLSMTQARYMRAIETLARVRRLKLPALQMNIAQAGAKQMNVAANAQNIGAV